MSDSFTFLVYCGLPNDIGALLVSCVLPVPNSVGMLYNFDLDLGLLSAPYPYAIKFIACVIG